MRNLSALPTIICGLGFSLLAHSQTSPAVGDPEFIGSSACQECHEAVYDRWEDTRMANILVDVNERPDAVLGDFSTPNPLVTFGRSKTSISPMAANGSNGTSRELATTISSSLRNGTS